MSRRLGVASAHGPACSPSPCRCAAAAAAAAAAMAAEMAAMAADRTPAAAAAAGPTKRRCPAQAAAERAAFSKHALPTCRRSGIAAPTAQSPLLAQACCGSNLHRTPSRSSTGCGTSACCSRIRASLRHCACSGQGQRQPAMWGKRRSMQACQCPCGKRCRCCLKWTSTPAAACWASRHTEWWE